MSDVSQNRQQPVDDGFVKIKYTTEDETRGCKIFYITAAIVALPILIICVFAGIILSKPVVFTHGILVSVFLGGIFIAVGRRQRVDCSLYINAHNRIMEQGTMYLGQVIELKAHYDRVLTRHGSQEVISYSYLVRYEDESHTVKTTDTYIVSKVDKKAVGKKCTVFEADGKVIVDAIERS